MPFSHSCIRCFADTRPGGVRHPDQGSRLPFVHHRMDGWRQHAFEFLDVQGRAAVRRPHQPRSCSCSLVLRSDSRTSRAAGSAGAAPGSVTGTISPAGCCAPSTGMGGGVPRAGPPMCSSTRFPFRGGTSPRNGRPARCPHPRSTPMFSLVPLRFDTVLLPYGARGPAGVAPGGTATCDRDPVVESKNTAGREAFACPATGWNGGARRAGRLRTASRF